MTVSHSYLQIGLRIGAFVVYIVTIIINALSSLPNIGLFLNSTGAVSDNNALDITPAGWTFAIWGVIYAWQALWLIFSLINICRSTTKGPVYLNPVILSPLFFIIYIINLCINISWLFLWDRQIMEAAFVFLALIVFTLYTLLAISHKALYDNTTDLERENRKMHSVLIRAFVHNGLGVYAGWTTVAMFLNMGIVVAYRSNPTISPTTASTVSLSCLAALILTYVITDLTVFDKYTRYTLSPYCALIWAISGSLQQNWDPSKYNSIITVVLLSLVILFLLIKIILVIVRSKTRPVFSSSVGLRGKE